METILTFHPLKRKGVWMKKDDYERLRKFILEELSGNSEISFQDLILKLSSALAGSLPENGAWSLLMVKLDLEARDIIRTKKHGYGRSPVLYLKRGAFKVNSV